MSLPTRTKVLFGSGTLAFGIKDQGFSALLMLYYNQVLGLPAALIGTAILIATLSDAVIDPLIGHASDRLRSPLGRRHPFMYAAALPMAVAYALTWSPPVTSHAGLFAWLIAVSLIVRLAISAFEIPSSALIAELTNDYVERTQLSTWRALFMAIGGVGMGVAVFKLFLVPTPDQPMGQLNAEGYSQYGYVAGGLMFISLLAATWGTHSRIPFLGQPPAADIGAGKSLFIGIKSLLSDRAYLCVVLCGFFFAIGGGICAVLQAYIGTYFWKLSSASLGTITAGMAIGVVLGLIGSAVFSRKDKKTVLVISYGMALAAFLLPVILRLLGGFNFEGQQLVAWLVAQSAVVGSCLMVGVIMAGSMMGDVADRIEEKSGRRMEGLMFAALVMIQKAVSGIGVFAAGIILSMIQFPEKADPATVGPAVIHELGLAYVLSAGIMIAIALVVASFYPITRDSHQRTLEGLKRLRGEVPA